MLKHIQLSSCLVLRNIFVAASLLGSASAAVIQPSAELVEQSPIAIRPENAQYSVLPPFLFNYASSTTLSLINTGSPHDEATVRADIPFGAGSVTVGTDVFNLLQFHFHIPGEHELFGDIGAMEMHLVHQSPDGTLLVIGQQIHEGPENQLLAPFFSNLPQSPGDTALINAFALSNLIPTDQRTFRYGGSLTTAPFLEGVRWNLFAEPLYLSSAQIAAFDALFPHGDARGLQTLNGRVVLTDVAGYQAVPEPSTLLLFSLGVFGLFGYQTKRKNRVS